MKLTDGFVAYLLKRTEKGHKEFVGSVAEADGVIFACPKCTAAGNPHAVLCWFEGKVPDDLTPGPGRWKAEGEGLHDLSLRPSVWLQGACDWHGYVTVGHAD